MPAHLLGPHVVGQRVVVRRLVAGETGPTGGPAFTDVLGVCTSWADGRAVIERDSGDTVVVPIESIVSGKPVPPRPSARLRVSAREAELHTAALFPAVEVVPFGEWSIRWEPQPVGRLRKRANSCLAMGSPGVPADEALAQVVDFYRGRERRPIVQVEQDSDVAAAVAEAGWSPIEGDAAFLVASVARTRRRLRPLGVSDASGTSHAPRVSADGRYVVVTGPDARGEAGRDGDWLGMHGVFVAEHARRRGLARAVMAELLEWGAEQGATTAWLHVETANEPALALYESLGFVEHHRCRYYAPTN